MICGFAFRNIVKITALVFFMGILFGCAHQKKNGVAAADLQNKRVALAEIKAGPDSKPQVEVALINALIEKGYFEIVDRSSVAEAIATYPTETDWPRLGKKVGADYILSLEVLEFDVKEREGFDSVTEEDSLLAEEAHSKKPVLGTRYVKVKGYEGTVRIRGRLFDVPREKIVFEGEGSSSEKHTSTEQGGAPRKLQLLEKLSTQAMNKFLERMLRI